MVDARPAPAVDDALAGRSAAVTRRHDVDLEQLRCLVEQETSLEPYPHASRVDHNVLVYEATDLRPRLGDVDACCVIRTELASALLDGPGVIVITAAVEPDVVDRASALFEQIIADERAAGIGAGDHYAEVGANERIWNALEKMAVAGPEVFVDYHGNDMIDLVALAWLGPAYQMTTQVNVINPGGAAQSPHRDFPLGFMTDETAEQYPLHMHRFSPSLTLQGAVVHGDTPPEAGSTMVLPHSQKFDLGYLAWRRDDLIDYFAERHVQLHLGKGDLLFFNHAVFHGGGHNRTADVRRMANLMQINSSLGRAMESVDRHRMVDALYPALLRRQSEGMAPELVAAAVAASAEGYAFPTNLDRDPPIDGLTPPSQQDLVFAALAAGTPPADLATQLAAHSERRRTH